MHETIPTVRIAHDDVPAGIVINTTDYDPATMTLHGAAPAPAAKRPAKVR